MDLKELMIKIFDEYNIKIHDGAYTKLERYMSLLLEWNEKVNLTAITEPNEILMKHFADSLIILKFLEEKDLNSRIIDIGTGAGFPGLPLKIANDGFRVTLMDSLNKRVKFLQAVVDELGLEGVSAVHSRAEDGARQAQHRQKYDFALSRAVARLNVLCEYALPYVKVGGKFIAYKGFDIEEELEEAKPAIALLGGKIEKIEKVEFKGTDLTEGFSRSIVFIAKIKETSLKYPRNSSIISKKPLI